MHKKEYTVKGMVCAACAARVQKALLKISGVQDVSVNLFGSQATVISKAELNDSDVFCAIEGIGYSASLKENADSEDFDNSKDRKLLAALLTSLVLTLVLMLFSMGPYLGIVITDNAFLSASLQALICVVIMYVQKRYFISALKALLHLSTNMDTLVSTGAMSSFVYSVCVLFNLDPFVPITVFESSPVYFESAAGILTFVSIGKYLEAKCSIKTRHSIRALKDLVPEFVTVKSGACEKIIRLTELKKGDVLIVKSGQRIGADGTVAAGEGLADESNLTGESRPVLKDKNSKVWSATVLTDGYIEVLVEKASEQSALSELISVVESTSNSKVRLSRLADSVASYFVPCVIALSIGVFIFWYFVFGAELALALKFAVAVLVISCPCALGIATPAAVVAGNGEAARSGIIFKNPFALENLSKIKCIAFDKTGTLTTGDLKVTQTVSFNSEYTQRQILSLCGLLEKQSSHSIARAIVKKAKRLPYEAHDLHYKTGLGVEGVIEGIEYGLGNELYLKQKNIALHDGAPALNKGQTALYLVTGNSLLGSVILSDEIKPDAKELIDTLTKKGIKTIMLTGDSPECAKEVSQSLGIKEYQARLSPQDKADHIARLKDEYGLVAMMGDGVNDSVSLSACDIGIGLSKTTDLSLASCDIVLMSEKITDFNKACELSKRTVKIIKENLFFALIYNVIAIPAAAGALYNSYGISLSPELCACLMGLSSVCVVLNALRLKSSWHLLKVFRRKQSSLAKMYLLRVDGMMCSHCSKTLQRELLMIDGVKNAEVSWVNGIARIYCNGSVLDGQIKDAVAKAGYTVKEVICD